MKQILFLLTVLFAVGCTSNFVEDIAYKIKKPVNRGIAIFPMQDLSSDRALSKGIVEDMAGDMYYQLLREGNSYVLPKQKARDLAKRVPKSVYSGKDLAPLKELEGVDYVVLTELIEYTLSPYVKKEKEESSVKDRVLVMKVKICVVNLMNGAPRVAFEETVQSNHRIPYNQSSKVNRSLTPVKKAHDKLVEELTSKVKRHCL